MGVILDANDAVIIGATVKIEGEGVKRVLKSGQEGQFAARLPAGRYRVTVEADGFRRHVASSVVVKANAAEKVSIRLEVAEPPGLLPASGRVLGREAPMSLSVAGRGRA